jgi:hypothetical protein
MLVRRTAPLAIDSPSPGERMKSILDPSFRYTSSLHTDVRKTFERIRRELQAQATKPIVQGERNRNLLALQTQSVVLR